MAGEKYQRVKDLRRATRGLHAASSVLDDSEQVDLAEAEELIWEAYRKALDDYERLPFWRRVRERIRSPFAIS